jgi:hypothetical protein
MNDSVTINGALKLNSTFNITDSTQSTSTTSGAFTVKGGVGIGSNLYVGGNVILSNSSTLVSSAGSFGNIRIAITDDNTIDTSSGNLTLDSATNIVNINAATNITGNTAITGNTTITGDLNVTGDITAFYTSDQRLKDNIVAIEDPLAKVLSISGNTYTWNEKSGKEGNDVGVIAQEVLEVLPEAVTTRDNGYLAVDYHKVVPLLIEAIKELSAKVDSLEKNTDK